MASEAHQPWSVTVRGRPVTNLTAVVEPPAVGLTTGRDSTRVVSPRLNGGESQGADDGLGSWLVERPTQIALISPLAIIVAAPAIDASVRSK